MFNDLLFLQTLKFLIFTLVPLFINLFIFTLDILYPSNIHAFSSIVDIESMLPQIRDAMRGLGTPISN